MGAFKMNWARLGVAGAFALVLATKASPARAEGMVAPGPGLNNFWSRVIQASDSRIVVPSAVRAARTSSKPVKPKPPIGISVTSGTIVYLQKHHQDPVMSFEIKVSRAPGATPVTVGFSTSGNTDLADSEFTSTTGQAVISGKATKYKVYIPIVPPLSRAKGNFLYLQLTDPANGILAKGVPVLVARGQLR